MNLFSENFHFIYSTDWDFYKCNILFWRDKLFELGINLPLDTHNAIKYCSENTIETFISGPIFPLLIYINHVLPGNLFLSLGFAIALFIFIYMSYKTTFLEEKNLKIYLTIILLICPSLLWLTFLPSSDLISSVFWISSIFFFKEYIFRVLKGIKNKKYPQKLFKYILIFSILQIFSLLTRPITYLNILTILTLIIFDLIVFIRYKKFVLQRLFYIGTNVLLITIILKIQLSLYSNYGNNFGEFILFNHSWSPPNPIGLKEATDISINKFIVEINSFFQEPYNWLSNFYKLFLLSITNLIFGIISISGIQVSKISYSSFPSFQNIASISKALYGIIFILPAILNLIILNTKNFFLYIFIPTKKIEFINYITDLNNYYKTALFFIISCHIFISLLIVPHIRYLTPILPFIISLYISNYSKKNVLG